MSSTKQVLIIGAGISGLALAYRLQQLDAACEITILEKAARPGGTVWTEERAGFRVELGPNGFLDNQPSTLQLCADLGLKDLLVPASEAAGRNRFLFMGNRLRALPASLSDLLTTDLLSWRGKINLALERFRPRGQGKDDESVDAFARRRGGPEIAEIFADALVTGIYAGDPALLSIQSSFPRIAALEKEYGSVLKGLNQQSRERKLAGEPSTPRRMWSFADGLRRLIDGLTDKLARPPELNVAVRRISNLAQEGGRQRWQVADGDRSWEADALVLTCPAYQQAGLLHDLDPQLADQVGAIAYNRIAVVAVGYRQADVPMPVDGFGYIAPQRTRRDILGVQWCSSIFPGRAPDGMVLLRALCGGWHRPEVAGWEDGRLLAAARAELQAAMKITAAPVFHKIVRWDRAIPQYLLGHGARVTTIESLAARHFGLFLGGNAYRGVALNDCTEQALILARRVHHCLAGAAG